MDMQSNEMEAWVADALEHLYDFSYLGTHPLANLRAVDKALVQDQTPLTHVDRGRALSKVLQIAIDELKPMDKPDDIGREAHFYAILSEAYRQGRENRDIALQLSISERTFYRDRRRALQALAHVLRDMEDGAP